MIIKYDFDIDFSWIIRLKRFFYEWLLASKTKKYFLKKKISINKWVQIQNCPEYRNMTKFTIIPFDGSYGTFNVTTKNKLNTFKFGGHFLQ